MRRFGTVTVRFLVTMMLFHPAVAWTQTEDARPAQYDVAWLEYEAAEAAARERDFSEALRRYARALELRPAYPEAFVGIARTYRRLNDPILAERYYDEALERVSQLQVPDDRYAIQLEKARLFDGLRNDRDYDRKYRNTLLTVIQDDPTFSANEPPGQREAMRRRLFADGINRVLVLYRVDFPEALEAHRLYGRYLLETRNHDEWIVASEHFLFAVVEIVGRAVDAVIEREFDYQFTTIGDLYRRAAEYPEIAAYIESEELLEALRNLQRALQLVDGVDTTVALASVAGEIEAITAESR